MNNEPFNDYDYYDRLSVAAAEVRDAIEENYSMEGLEALKKVVNDLIEGRK
jgi:hypothetical protein